MSSASSKAAINGSSPSPTTATSNSQKMAPPSVAPRLEIQPHHEALKGALTKENWMTYTEALNKFLRGRLSDQELLEDIGPFIKGPKIRLHNSLLMALISNITRDAPQVDVATWVSASDKPSSVTKLPAGDINERRLKKEIMAISARERKRIKEVPEKNENIEDMLGNALMEYHTAKQVKPPDPPPRSATINKTNWESEIKQRYMLPLASETGEFPDVDNIRLRMLPICYEEGIPGGCSVETANFMNVAAETFVKEILTTIIGRVRSNGPIYVQTDAYRKLAPKGRWVPRQERPLLGMHDVRLSLTLGDNLLTQMPTSMKKIMAGGWYERDYEVDTALQFEDTVDVGEWQGGAPEDRKELKGLLDDCLALGT
ncbi:transcriptional regulator of RNA polII, SAGA, subunit-domain-containing protein [Tricharina praecox]|uniref:transcriptional regulator of RNA polII, SAGA, subunit-domain-containing protein n=1 Tax=Tricharina praecox TaxID=43433 RepID=UPI00221EE5A5|nr:transcriptional regulator of RNA polII, SAGA, subunit-domain-containing protein [Tricharina praecox]KAI5858786.1 transcriptional regulator of RNA polII, SAGA, subunit-domain-containing protein [Tricharina praecox]